jgi:hypothetical protein
VIINSLQAGCVRNGQQRRGLTPQGAGTPLVTLSMEPDQSGPTELEVRHPQVRNLLDPCPGVVEEEEQGTVSEGEPPGPR